MSNSNNLMIAAGLSLALAGAVGAAFPHVRNALERADNFREALPAVQAQFDECARAALPPGYSDATVYFQASPMGGNEFGVTGRQSIAGGVQSLAVHGRNGDVQRVSESFVIYGEAHGTLHFLSGKGGAVYVEGPVETLREGSPQAAYANSVGGCARAALEMLG